MTSVEREEFQKILEDHRQQVLKTKSTRFLKKAGILNEKGSLAKQYK